MRRLEAVHRYRSEGMGFELPAEVYLAQGYRIFLCFAMLLQMCPGLLCLPFTPRHR